MLICDLDAHQDRHSPTYFDDSESEESFRIFVALFDYDPSSMSPNPDAADEELPFKEGQIIKVCVCVCVWGRCFRGTLVAGSGTAAVSNRSLVTKTRTASTEES